MYWRASLAGLGHGMHNDAKPDRAMKLVTIFQQRNPDYLATIQGRDMPLDDLQQVASFTTDLPAAQALDEAYRLTKQWDDTARLTMEPGAHRSTSIGDVVMVDGQAFQCVRAGWKKVEFSPSPE